MKHDCNAADERVRDLEAELAETRLQVDCGKEPCSWVGGACVHHYRRYYGIAKAEIERLKGVAPKTLTGQARCYDCGYPREDHTHPFVPTPAARKEG